MAASSSPGILFLCAQRRRNAGVLMKTLYLQCNYIQITFFMCCIVLVAYVVYNLERKHSAGNSFCSTMSDVKLFRPSPGSLFEMKVLVQFKPGSV